MAFGQKATWPYDRQAFGAIIQIFKLDGKGTGLVEHLCHEVSNSKRGVRNSKTIKDLLTGRERLSVA